MADRTETPTSPEKPVTTAGGSKIMIALMALNSLLMAGVLGVTLLRSTGRMGGGADHGGAPSHAAAEGGSEGAAPAAGSAGAGASAGNATAAAAPRPGPMLALPDFVVHLRDPDSDRYARLTLNVELGAESDKEVLNAHLPQIRDAFLAYLSDRTVEELRGSEGMGLVKQDLSRRLHELLPSAPVKALYVTDIVVQ